MFTKIAYAGASDDVTNRPLTRLCLHLFHKHQLVTVHLEGQNEETFVDHAAKYNLFRR